MTTFFSLHAIDRARERYGLELSAIDMLSILAACTGGNALRIHSNADSAVYLMHWHGVRIIPVLRGRVIISFLPQKACSSKNGLRMAQKSGAKQKRGIGKNAVRYGPRRPLQSLHRHIEQELEGVNGA